MNKVILLLVIIGFASAFKAESLNNLWSAWKVQHKKIYTAAEEVTRFGIFIENFNKIHRLNKEHEAEGLKFGLNQFADLTGHEFAYKVNGGLYDNDRKSSALETVELPVGDLPESVDWRTKGAVTPVKDQGQCGSCWAFSTTGVLEGFYFVNNGKLLSFSEQQIVDCNFPINLGCNGGLPYKAVKYVANHGISLESDYPYTAAKGKCQFDSARAIKVAGGYKFVTPKSTDQLKAALVNSPVSIGVQADQDVFHFYKSGVVTKNCGANLNHAVLAVGYKVVDGVEAFIVKNSWTASWGQEGYIHIGTDQTQNNGKGVCGILGEPLIVTA